MKIAVTSVEDGALLTVFKDLKEGVEEKKESIQQYG